MSKNVDREAGGKKHKARDARETREKQVLREDVQWKSAIKSGRWREAI